MRNHLNNKFVIGLAAFLCMLSLAISALGQVTPRRAQPLPTDEFLRTQLVNVGESLGWALMYSDPNEGLYIWRFKLRSLRHSALEGRFVWYMKRIGNTLAVDDPLQIMTSDTSEGDFQDVPKESNALQAEFRRRWLELVGPVEFQGATDTTHSATKLIDALKSTLQATELPAVLGDLMVVISDRAEVMRDNQVVDIVPRGAVLEVRGLAGDHLKVRYRQTGTIDRQNLVTLDAAIAVFTADIEKNRQDANAYSLRGNARAFSGDYANALTDFNRAHQLDPAAASAVHFRGLARAFHGDYAKSIADFSEAIRLDPKDPMIVFDRGVSLCLQGKFDQAITDFDAAIQLDPQYARAYQSRGAAWAAKQEYAKALADFNQSIRLDPDDADNYFQRGYAEAMKEEFNKAGNDLLEAARLDPKYVYLQYDQ